MVLAVLSDVVLMSYGPLLLWKKEVKMRSAALSIPAHWHTTSAVLEIGINMRQVTPIHAQQRSPHAGGSAALEALQRCMHDHALCCPFVRDDSDHDLSYSAASFLQMLHGKCAPLPQVGIKHLR